MIRPFEPGDLPPLVALTIETFRPFYEGYVRALLGERLFEHQHGRWEQDYRDDLPTLHNPTGGSHIAVFEMDGVIVGFVSWRVTHEGKHGEIYLLAVIAEYRRQNIGRQLCEHAISRMRSDGADAVGIGTGEDAFHAPARALYEELGFTKIPIAGYLRAI